MIAVFGPTGVGKTALALALADRLREQGSDPVAISADALQVYRGLEIITGAPSAAERERLEHRLVGFVPLNEEYSAGRYMEAAHAEIDAVLEAGRTPIVVGGTGLYLRAALAQLDLAPPLHRRSARGWRHRTRRRCTPSSPPGTRSWRQRSILATASAWCARWSCWRWGTTPPRPDDESQLWTADTRHPTLLVGLTMDRDALYAAIDARVDAMVAAGAADEVRRADAAGASRTARYALGFDELLAGDVEGMKRRTRNYARRQLTWMRKLDGVRLTDVTDRDPDDLAASVAAAADADL